MSRPNVVLWGCPRSGTSLFLEFFEALGYSTYFEPGMDFVTHSLLPEAAARNGRPWAIKNPIDVGGYRTPGLACDVRDLRAALGSDYVSVWLVRHPLDAICSLRKGLNQWHHQPIPPGYLNLSNAQVDERGVGMWLYVNGEGRRAVNPDLTVRYEDLIAEPVQEVARIATAIGDTFPATITNAFARRVSGTSGVHEAAHQARWITPHRNHIGRWREDMNIEQLQYAVTALGSMPADFSYSLPIITETA